MHLQGTIVQYLSNHSTAPWVRDRHTFVELQKGQDDAAKKTPQNEGRRGWIVRFNVNLFTCSCHENGVSCKVPESQPIALGTARQGVSLIKNHFTVATL